MTQEEINELNDQWLKGKAKPWFFHKDFSTYIKTLKPTEPELRTEKQADSLFLWFSRIEKEAENAGVTWDMVIKHTHQLRVTKEALHGMCKLLIKALWGIESTKLIKKREQLDIIIDHFVALFAKEGLELPPFPFDPQKLYAGNTNVPYPTEPKGPANFDVT